MIANLTRDILETFLPVGMVDILMPLLGILIVVNVLLGSAVMLTYAERRLVARMQNRIGPNRVGPFGALQGVADLLKLVIKEDLTPRAADRLVFLIAPILFFAPAIALFAVVPFFDGWAVADLDAGIVYVIAVASVSSLAAFAAGWASNNKYSLYGAMRGVAQLVSYEVPLILAVTSVVLLAGSLSLQEIVEAQGIPFVLVQPLGFLIMLIAVTAELNRTPFDINEAESEIVAGFHTEYSGTKFALIYGAEYVAALGWSAVIVTLFFAGWKPDIGGILWFALKTSLIVFLFFWFRGTWPRVRIDQMLALAWKLLFPLATINILVTAGEVLAMQALFSLEPGEALPAAALAIIGVINIGLTVGVLALLGRVPGLAKFDNQLAAPAAARV